jgi:hypothetical protein
MLSSIKGASSPLAHGLLDKGRDFVCCLLDDAFANQQTGQVRVVPDFAKLVRCFAVVGVHDAGP